MDMRASLKYVLPLCLASAVLPAFAANDCEIHLMARPVEQVTGIPDEINEQMISRLTVALTKVGVAASPDYGQFFLTGKFLDAYKDVVPGPPKSHVMHTTLTLYVGDAFNQTVYSTCSFDLRGVGASEQRAYINALSGLNASNKKFSDFVEAAKVKIINYYDNNYKTILAKAERAAAMRNYDEALMYSVSIPECSKGYGEASRKTLSYYQSYIDYEGQMLLTAARAAWAESPDREGAEIAHGYLLQIDPAAACYPQAESLMSNISKVVKSNWDFENREKYKDALETERRLIDAARAVGVAYGNGQQPQTTNLMWLK